MTHPFHPLAGKELELISMHRSGGGWRLFFPDAQGRLRSVPMAFTNLAASDPFRVQSAGRSYFRISELLELFRLIAGIKERRVPSV